MLLFHSHHLVTLTLLDVNLNLSPFLAKEGVIIDHDVIMIMPWGRFYKKQKNNDFPIF